MTLNQLTVRHVNEYANLVKQQKFNEQKLEESQLKEIKVQGNSSEIQRKHKEQLSNVLRDHKEQRQTMVNQHENEYQEFCKQKDFQKSAANSLAYSDQLEAEFILQKQEKLKDEYEQIRTSVLEKKNTPSQEKKVERNHDQTNTQTVTQEKQEEKAKIVESLRQQWGMKKDIILEKPTNDQSAKQETELTKEEKRARLIEDMKNNFPDLSKKKEKER